MPKSRFHYVWMGRLPDSQQIGAFKDGPNALAQQLKELQNVDPADQEIIMWVPEDLVQSVIDANLLDPSIKIKPIEDLYHDAKRLTDKERDNLQITVDLLGEHNAYSAQKDLISAAIMEEYGGYYLDTTTEITDANHLIQNQPEDVWFPRRTEDDATIHDGQRVPLVDVWALYNPEQSDGTYRAMMNSYIQRCQFYFPEKFPDQELAKEKTLDSEGYHKTGYWLKDEKGTPHEGQAIMNNPRLRDKFIGMLVITSLLDGLNETKGLLSLQQMKKFSSYAKERVEDLEVAGMGIIKFHRGLWRTERIATMADRRESDKNEQESNEIKAEKQRVEPQKNPQQNNASVSNFNAYKSEYRALKSDFLQAEIIDNFKEHLSQISDEEELDHFVRKFKESTEYNKLADDRGFLERLFNRMTEAQIKCDELVDTRRQEIRESNRPEL